MSLINTKPLSEQEVERLKKSYPVTFGKAGSRYVRTQPGNCVLLDGYESVKDRFKHWDVRSDDTYLFCFPRSGSTWTMELLWCIQNDCNIEAANSAKVLIRVPWMDIPLSDKVYESLNVTLPGYLQVPPGKERLQTIEEMPSPRILRSHLPFCLMPDDIIDKSKVIICLRNPKDVLVSYYHLQKLLRFFSYEDDFSTFFDLFMDNLVVYGPYFDHIAQTWEKRHHPNVCILFYEDTKSDLAGTIKKMAKFLGKEVTEKQMESLIDHLSLSRMKGNTSLNLEELQDGLVFRKEGKFIRKGQIGDWKNYFTEEMNRRMDEAIEKHFKPIGLEFKYE